MRVSKEFKVLENSVIIARVASMIDIFLPERPWWLVVDILSLPLIIFYC